MMPRFGIGDLVKIVRLDDEMTSRDLIGLEGTVEELDELPNDQTNYYVDGHYMHEGELILIVKAGYSPDRSLESKLWPG